MNTFVVLLRGLNIWGKTSSRWPLLAQLEAKGFSNVASYIASGNLILGTRTSAAATRMAIEGLLVSEVGLGANAACALVLTRADLEAVVKKRQNGFGDEPASPTATPCSDRSRRQGGP